MTINDLIKQLFIAFSKKDDDSFYELAEEIINLEKRKKHNILAKELKEALYNSDNFNVRTKRNYRINKPIPRDNDSGFPLVDVKKYNYLDWEQLILPENIKYELEQIINGYRSKEVLATYNLAPKLKYLFCGLPGTGKTYSVKILSSIMNLPLVYVNFDAIISSYLGETASNLRKVFEFIKDDNWIVLFDEVDIIGKNRDDQHESGEIKRVVNNFLQMIDNYNGESIIIAATNHPHILDPAIWRRFDEVIIFELPRKKEREKIIKLYLQTIKKDKNITLDYFVKETEGFSPSDIKTMCQDAVIHSVVNGRDVLSLDDLDYSLKKFKLRLKQQGK
ncbi:MAG: ATP-binding protein [Erysipelothrix sp.]|nr:ATP-binding protein [Erysipelothrix sp.]